jgi:hypothetical protein
MQYFLHGLVEFGLAGITHVKVLQKSVNGIGHESPRENDRINQQYLSRPERQHGIFACPTA